MERCAYCGERVGDDGLYVDDEVFCSEDCMRDYGADGGGGDDDDFDDDDDDDSDDRDDNDSYGDDDDDDY
ncbi:MAG TPA: hypothetical protein VFH88_14900 [Candidatus Krumholzibacteria bacterium]|nr:hypothetical protein [Candidatus Krumholzibacteria bacterium]